jgi:hypothetical protein
MHFFLSTYRWAERGASPLAQGSREAHGGVDANQSPPTSLLLRMGLMNLNKRCVEARTL